MPRVPFLIAATLVAAACSSTATTTATTAPPPPPTTAAPTTTTTPTTAAPFTGGYTVDDHVAWVVGLLNGDPPDEAEYEARFDDAFRAQVPYAAFAAPLGQLAGDWAVTSDARSPDGLEATVLLQPVEGPRLVAVLSAEPDPPGRLRGLLIQPAQLDDPPQSLDELAARWATLAPQAELLIADTAAELACNPLAAAGSGEQLAIGSVFKLWVLAALAMAVEDGGAAWDEVFPVQEELKSLPSGTMQDEPAGAEFTLERHARLMISISDNTATDHLIDRLGRRAVEAAVAATGHAEPGRNRPFLTTRELFWLKLVAPQEAVDAYLAGGEEERRALLDGAAIDLSGIDITGAFPPTLVDRAEWFASTGDVCRALTSLWRRYAATPVRDVLTVNPGVVLDPTEWGEVGFKGGSEPGVLALAWYAERADGRAFVVAGILNDTEQRVDEITAFLLAERAFELLADL